MIKFTTKIFNCLTFIFYILVAFMIFIKSLNADILKIDKFNVSEEVSIVTIKGYGVSYGVGLDSLKNIYIPSFDRGFLYKISPDLKNYSVYDLQDNKLEKISENKSPKQSQGKFVQPHDITFDEMDNLYVTEMGLGRGKLGGQVTKISKNGEVIAKIGSDYNENKGLDGPTVSHFAKDGFLYVSEWRAHRILRYDNNYKIDKIIGKKNDDKENLFDALEYPHALRIGPKNEIYIADTNNHRIVKLDKAGNYLGWIGKRDDGTINDDWSAYGNSIKGSELGAFSDPIDLEIFQDKIYITEYGNHRITKIDLSGRSLGFIGETNQNKDQLYWDTNGEQLKGNSLVGLHSPFGLRIVDKIMYVADKNNGRIKIIKSNLFD